jgi:hypothetical protein
VKRESLERQSIKMADIILSEKEAPERSEEDSEIEKKE